LRRQSSGIGKATAELLAKNGAKVVLAATASASLGALVIVFQYNWVEMLGLAGGGFVSSRIPLILFVILFGLSTDYQVFVVSRIREAALRGLSTRDAVFEGITGTAVVVTSAAVVMVSVFISFMFVSYLELK
jgi:RND superfamily putative drug exporter